MREGEAKSLTRKPGDLPFRCNSRRGRGGVAWETYDMTTFTEAQSAGAIRESERTAALRAALVAFTLGATILFTVGFSHSATIHDTAHDTRHAMAFPCH